MSTEINNSIMETNYEECECPICFDTIEGNTNKIITTCNHIFHASCLMKNVAHNGFGCPYCRNTMAEIPDEDEESDEEFSFYQEEDAYQSNALRGARWLFQRAEGEEVDDSDESETESEIGSQAEEDDDVEDLRPTAEQITEELIKRGVSLEELVKSILLDNHPEYQEEESFVLRSNILFGKIRRIITSHRVPIPNLLQEQDQEIQEIQEEIQEERVLISRIGRN